MRVISYGLLVLALGGIGFLLWQILGRRKEPLVNREFGYLRWVIYLLNVFIIALGLGLVLGLGFGLFHWLSGGDWVGQLPNGVSVGFGIEVSAKTPISIGIDLINTIAALGILVCMRAFMKNILAEQIFVADNVRLARLSTLFLVLGSLVREGIDKSGLIMHGQYPNGQVQVSYEYSFFIMEYFLIAVLVWSLSIILEKAIAIAEENEFTI